MDSVILNHPFTNHSECIRTTRSVS